MDIKRACNIQDVPVKDQNRNSIDFKSEGQLKTLGTI